MLLKLQHKVISIWSGVMKYKVLKDYPTTDGVLYEKEIVKVWDAKTTDGNLRVKDNMGRIWNVPKNILKEVSNG
jgi:hypothetical protein